VKGTTDDADDGAGGLDRGDLLGERLLLWMKDRDVRLQNPLEQAFVISAAAALESRPTEP
jgi:hypothetical protein